MEAERRGDLGQEVRGLDMDDFGAGPNLDTLVRDPSLPGFVIMAWHILRLDASFCAAQINPRWANVQALRGRQRLILMQISK